VQKPDATHSKLLSLLCNRKPSTISVHKLRRTNLQLWQGSSRLSRCPQGRPRGRQQQALRHQIRAAVPCAPPRSSSGTGTPHGWRSQVGQVREHQHQISVLISHRAALTGCSQDALRFRCTPGARGIEGLLGVICTSKTSTSMGSGQAYALALPLVAPGRHHR
jgi:hypothetical protein